jgi:hypothetical protein
MPQDEPDTPGGHDLEGRLDTVKRELDALQIHVMKEKTPWYRQVPVIVSLLVSVGALAFSFWTDLKAEDRLELQREHEARVELRGVIQRLQSLPRERIELNRKYASDANTQATAQALIATETEVLARQAEELIKELEGQVTAAEYYAVIGGFVDSGRSVDLESLITGGLAVAEDATSAATLYRYAARARFTIGDTAGGRATYEKALKVFERFPERNQSLVNTTQAQTEVLWAEDELRIKDCDAAWRHVTLAQGYGQFAGSVAQTVRSIEAGCGPKRAS